MQNDSTAKNYSGNDLWLLIKSNDKRALDLLYDENFKTVEQFVIMNSGSSEEAQDVYQEAFIAVWRNIQLDKFFPKSDYSLSAYLIRVAKNKWIDHLRSKYKKSITALDEDYSLEAEEQAIDSEDEKYLEEVKKQFENLGENCRELLVRFYFYQDSLEDIGKRFKWSKATARNNKYRCLKKLKSLLNK